MADKSYLVLTAVGPDRPGLVNEIASVVREAKANVEDSRMAILGGEFALLMLLSGSAEATARFEAACPSLSEKLGLRLIFKHTTRKDATRDFLPYGIRVTGVDRPGIVHNVTSVLAKRGVNLAALESKLSFAPLSGTPMFVLEADLQVPSEVALSELRRELVALCDEENLDFVLESKS
jgi:glycine cleavage system transcriptional repressor